MTLNEVRKKILKLIKEGKPLSLIAKEIGISRFTLSDFLKDKRQPRYENIVKMKKYLQNT